MSSRIWDGPCPTCGKYSLDCTCGLFYSKENESMESHQERKELYELTSIRDESLHVQPYADMIDKLTYVQKADFAKRALELERDCATYKKMFEEVSRERNAWISEYRAARAEVERTKLDRDLFKTERDMWKNEVDRLTKILRRYDQEDDINDGKKALKDIALEFTKMNYNTSDIETNPYYKGCLAGLISQEVTVDHMAKHIDELTERKDQLEEWLTEYRDQLKKENVFHKNQGVINAINEILNENT